MRMRYFMAITVALAALGAQARAQDTTTKPGGLNKIAHNVSGTAKKAGRDTKAELKRASSGAHRALKANGNEAKEDAAAATGIHNPTPGPIDKAARKVSSASKKTGAHAKHAVKKSASKTHDQLAKAGKEAKEDVKKP